MVQTLRFVYCGLLLATLCEAFISPCKIDDQECLLTTANNVYQAIVAGDTSIGTEVLDPIFIEEIVGSIPMMKYTLTNSTIVGHKNCEVKDISIDMQQNNLKFNLLCPELIIFGDYTINGRLIILPIEGTGNQTIVENSVNLYIVATLKVMKNEDDKEYINIKKVNVDAEPEQATFRFDNLFNGEKMLSDAVHKFANANSKEVAREFQGPVFSTVFKRFIKSTNKFLKAMPMEHLFLQ